MNPQHHQPTTRSDLSARVITKREAADMCAVCERTISNWVRLKGFPVLRVGRVVRFDPVRIRQWLAAQDGGAS